MKKEKESKIKEEVGKDFLCVIRISGQVGLRKKVAETLHRLKIRRKYSCIVLANPTKEEWGMIKKVYDLVALGTIDEKLFLELLKSRAQLLDKSKKVNLEEVPKKLKEGKKYSELNLKPFFRLHPPRGGIESKKHFGVGKGVLGNAGKNIDKLLRRML